MTGDGIKEFFDAVEASRDEYEKRARFLRKILFSVQRCFLISEITSRN